MAKKSSYKRQKDKTWDAFSRYIRVRDCLYSTGTPYMGRCVTCGAMKQFEDLQAGHFIDGRGNSILFDERGVHAQCYSCNVCKHGNKVEYFRFMQANFSDAVIDELRANRGKAVKLTEARLKEMEAEYKERTAELIEGDQPMLRMEKGKDSFSYVESI